MQKVPLHGHEVSLAAASVDKPIESWWKLRGDDDPRLDAQQL
jgi:hypothetical protein